MLRKLIILFLLCTALLNKIAEKSIAIASEADVVNGPAQPSQWVKDIGFKLENRDYWSGIYVGVGYGLNVANPIQTIDASLSTKTGDIFLNFDGGSWGGNSTHQFIWKGSSNTYDLVGSVSITGGINWMLFNVQSIGRFYIMAMGDYQPGHEAVYDRHYVHSLRDIVRLNQDLLGQVTTDGIITLQETTKEKGGIIGAVGFAPRITVGEYDFSRFMFFAGAGAQFVEIVSSNLTAAINMNFIPAAGITFEDNSWEWGNGVSDASLSIKSFSPVLPRISAGIDFAINKNLHLRLSYNFAFMGRSVKLNLQNEILEQNLVSNETATSSGSFTLTRSGESGLQYFNHNITFSVIALL